MTTVDFSKDQLRTVGQQYVYLRQVWRDDWVLYSTIQCLDATWCLSPTMPTATITRDYGHIQQLDAGDYDIFAKMDIVGWYVKIVFQTEIPAGATAYDTKTWYGVVSHMEDENRGLVTYGIDTMATGNQTWQCYGLEKLLDTEVLKESWVNTGETSPLIVQLPITFNRNGAPNRSDLVMDPENSYVFEGRVMDDPSYPITAEWWSSFHIIDYLLSWATPKASFFSRTAMVPFKLPTADAMYVSTLDRPTIDQEGHTILSLLQRLIDRRRLRAFYLEVDETTTPHDVLLRVAPWNNDIIDTGIDGVDVLLQNTNVRTLLYDYNQSTTALLRQSRVAKFDQVVVRGARRTSTATFHVGDGFLEAAWTGDEETAYETAASGVTGYGTMDRLEQQQRNAEVRGREALSHVFSWFRLPDDWGGTVLDTASATAYYVFIEDSLSTRAKQYIHDVVWEPTLPFYEHVDYSGSIIADGTHADPAVRVKRLPRVFFKVPTDDRWVPGDIMRTLAESTYDPDDNDGGDGKNFRWSAHVIIQPDTRTLEVRVGGEEQHVIAKTDFDPLTGDDRNLGAFDYLDKKMFITATLLDNRYAEGKYPADDGVGDSSLIDCQFGYVIYAGDDFRQDYVVPTTVLDVDTEGAFITTDGGYVRDDTDLLAALARITYEWWNKDRQILTLATTQLTSALDIGDFIDTIGTTGTGHAEQINTVISELRITWPRLEAGEATAPMMELTTGAGELDPMTMAPKVPEAMSRSKARVRR